MALQDVVSTLEDYKRYCGRKYDEAVHRYEYDKAAYYKRQYDLVEDAIRAICSKSPTVKRKYKDNYLKEQKHDCERNKS